MHESQIGQVSDKERLRLLTGLGVAYGKEKTQAKFEAQATLDNLRGRPGHNIPHADDLPDEEADRIRQIGEEFVDSDLGNFFAFGSLILALVNANDQRCSAGYVESFLEYFGDETRIKKFREAVEESLG